MSKINWTDAQQNVIDARDKNILVAAGAGSGKTTVLVERIIEMITDEKNPIDIDKFLIVTFTRSAAAQMKDKIRERLYKLSYENPKDMNVRRQLSLIHTANISTIDSFANQIVSRYFETLDIDPNFRMMEQEESDMLMEDSIREVLDELYESGDEEFLNAMEVLAEGSASANVLDYIKSIIKKANNQVFPKKWLEHAIDANYYESKDQFEKSVLVRHMMEQFEAYTAFEADLADVWHQVEEIGTSAGFTEMVKTDFETLSKLQNANTYDEYRNAIVEHDPKNISTPKFEYVNEGKAAHNLLKTYCENFTGKKYKGTVNYFPTFDEAFEDVNKSQKLANVLIDIAIKAIDKDMERKRYLSALNFNDVAHMALEIICEPKEDGSAKPSEVAREMAKEFHEILIDEYQDSNEIQENMLKSLARGFDVNNLFMVGDVKQSIYRFRSAEPRIFLEKYNEYDTSGQGDEIRIDLDDNFRSRPEIISATNQIFEEIMTEDVGGIDYSDGAQLKFGAKKTYDLDVNDGENDNRTEFVCVSSEGKSRHVIEAEFIAKRIKKLMDKQNGLKLTDKSENRRPLTYKDIVILTKAPATVVDTYINTLEEYGIPVFGEKKYGFYAATEIRTILDFLRIVDNPVWDIPLAGVLTSAIYGFTSEELALIKAEKKKVEKNKQHLYDNLIYYRDNGSDADLKEKVVNFLDELESYRKKSKYLSVYEFIEEMLANTHFDHYIRSLPIGERRQMNIDMLKEIAYNFEQTAYRGLFNFVRYVDKNIENEQDQGEAVEVGEEDDVVRITSIHKSKGLEYPVVFLANANYTSNNSRKDDYFVDPFGDIGTFAYDVEEKTKTKTLTSRFIEDFEKREQRAEDLRVLYVAMTRAREKLIVISSFKGEINKDQLQNFTPREDCDLFSSSILNASNYHQFIAPVLGKELIQYLPMKDGFTYESKIFEHYFDDIRFMVIPEISNYGEEIQKEEDAEEKEEDAKQSIVDIIKNNFEYKYKYRKELRLRAKMTVTEIKRRANEEFVDEDADYFIPNRSRKVKPRFADTEKSGDITGAELGNIYHKVFELLDFDRDYSSDDDINVFLETLVQNNKLTEDEIDAVDNEKIKAFVDDDLFGRMKSAYERNELYRERKFLLQVNGEQTKKIQKLKVDTEETTIVQGIIDACFIEDGKYVIVDYKTDNVDAADMLKEEYAEQLNQYEQAVKQISGKEVAEKIIYSVKLGEVVKV